MDLKNSVAVVTGGNGGLGQRICHALAQQGANIAVVYAKSEEQAEQVARDIRTHDVEAATFACDLTKPEQIQKLADDVVKKFGRLDILINDAAYNKSIPFQDLDGLTTEEAIAPEQLRSVVRDIFGIELPDRPLVFESYDSGFEKKSAPPAPSA